MYFSLFEIVFYSNFKMISFCFLEWGWTNQIALLHLELSENIFKWDFCGLHFLLSKIKEKIER